MKNCETKNSWENFFLMWQVNGSSFPIGIASHSFGLETYIDKGIIHNEKTCENFIRLNMKTAYLYTELLSMRFAYEFAKEADFEKVIKLDKLLHVSKSPQELRIASEKIGMNFIEAIKPLQMEYGEGIFSKYISELEENINPCNHSVMFGVFTAEVGIDKDLAMRAYLFSGLNAMITACIKGIPLSQVSGQKIIKRSYDLINDLCEEVKTLEYDDLCRSTPGLDISSMEHECQYSRLYMS